MQNFRAPFFDTCDSTYNLGTIMLILYHILPDATEKEVEDKQGRQGETPPDRSRCSEAGQVVRSAEKRGRTRAGDNVT
jgi:hypothetical protein